MGLLGRIEEREKSRANENIGIKPNPEESPSIQTDIDKIHIVVEKYGSMAIKDIAVVLKLGAERVEELAKILDKYKMAELYYPPVGSAVLRKTGGSAKSGNNKKNKNLNLLIFGIISLIILIAMIVILKIYGVI